MSCIGKWLRSLLRTTARKPCVGCGATRNIAPISRLEWVCARCFWELGYDRYCFKELKFK